MEISLAELPHGLTVTNIAVASLLLIFSLVAGLSSQWAFGPLDRREKAAIHVSPFEDQGVRRRAGLAALAEYKTVKKHSRR